MIDENEAVEAEVLFYNYGPANLTNLNGYAYMHSLPKSWYTNLPSGYLDTRFGDDGKEISYAVGTADPEDIQTTVQYTLIMTGQPSTTFVPRGLWSINYSRGYWYDSTNPTYRAVRGTGDEWFVFNEEKESYALIKQYHKYNEKYYAPGTFSEYVQDGYVNQFRYKQTFPLVSNGSNIDILNIDEGHYRVYKLQVATSATYDIRTLPNTFNGQKDTILRLYNHDFEQIDYNDDYGGFYSRILRTLTPGDYYIIVHGYNDVSMSSYLNVAIQ